AVLAADDGADGHAAVAAAVGLATRRLRAPRRDRAAVPPVAVAGRGAGRVAVRLPELRRPGTRADGHRARGAARRARLPARHPLGRSGAHALPGDALPQRRPALDAADHAARLRRAAGAGAAGLRADLRAVRLPG